MPIVFVAVFILVIISVVYGAIQARKRREDAARDARVERWPEDSGNAALAGRELPPAHKQDYWFSFFILTLPALFPDLTIRRENFFTKVAEVFGCQDIKFESAEFSKTFCVRSPDKKFAYDVCNAKMMEYLLANRDLSIEIENEVIALVFNTRLSVGQIELNLQRLVEIRSRLPEYLFTNA